LTSVIGHYLSVSSIVFLAAHADRASVCSYALHRNCHRKHAESVPKSCRITNLPWVFFSETPPTDAPAHLRSLPDDVFKAHHWLEGILPSVCNQADGTPRNDNRWQVPSLPTKLRRAVHLCSCCIPLFPLPSHGIQETSARVSHLLCFSSIPPAYATLRPAARFFIVLSIRRLLQALKA
jgi:hypothetical protein